MVPSFMITSPYYAKTLHETHPFHTESIMMSLCHKHPPVTILLVSFHGTSYESIYPTVPESW